MVAGEAAVAVAAAAVGIGALAQSTTGFGFSLVCAPFLVAAFGAKTGVPVDLIISSCVNVAVFSGHPQSADWRGAALLSAPGVVASVALGLLVATSSSPGITVAAGLVTIFAAAVVASGFEPAWLGRAGGMIGAGLVSGSMNVVSGVGGPPVVLYSVAAGWTHDTRRATLQIYFLAINLAGLATLGLPRGVGVRAWAEMAGGIVLGVVVGRLVASRTDEGRTRHAVIGLAAVGGLLAVLKGAGVISW